MGCWLTHTCTCTPHRTTEKASALSAAVNWVFRDGVGMACSLVFSSLAATSFDGNIKEWRLFADVINDLGLTLGAMCLRPCHLCGMEKDGGAPLSICQPLPPPNPHHPPPN